MRVMSGISGRHVGSGLPEHTASFVVNGPPQNKFYIRRGYGRPSKTSWAERPSADHIPAEEWEACREVALAAEHSQLTAANLDGKTIGDAFVRCVIQDPKVQATGNWLVLECWQFASLYEEGRCPVLIPERPRRNRTRVRPPDVNLGFAELKKGPDYPPTDLHDSVYTGPPSGQPPMEWRTAWPTHVGEKELSAIFLSQYSPGANYQDDPTEGPIYHAAKAIVDRHRAFFELLRTKKLIAEGIFKQTGQEQDVPAKIFERDDVYLDIECNELRHSENKTAAPVVTYKSVTLRLVSAATSAATTPKVAAKISLGPSTNPSPPSLGQGASVAPPVRKRGPKELVRVRVAREMKRDIAKGRLTRKRLAQMLEKVMAQRYGASRNTCRKARNSISLGKNDFPSK